MRVGPWWRVAAGILLGSAGAMIAWACADGGYDTRWDAEASSGILSPGNDTRSNFILLMADRYGTKVADPAQMAKGIVPFEFPYKVMIERLGPPVTPTSDYSAEYREQQAQYGLSSDSSNYFGSDGGNLGLCHTNRSGAQQFAVALKADPAVPADEQAALGAARVLLAKGCDKAGDMGFALSGVSSPEGRAFARYVEGTRLFYAEDLPAAAQQFASVGRARSAWLTESAAYMAVRTAMAQAMKCSIGQWGELADIGKRNRAAIDNADVVRRQYLQAYPASRYAASARNFERRIAWLRGDKAALGAAYSAMLARKPADGGPDTGTMEEVDLRMLPSGDSAGVTDPTLLAVTDLMRLRPKTVDYHVDYEGPELARAELEQQRAHFQSEPDLFGYLLAAEAYYHRKQPSEVLALIPDAAHQARFGYVQFSRQMLRGFALEALGDRNARGFWLSLLPGATQPYQRATVELALYRHDEKAGAVGRLLETGSPILHPLIRQKVIEDDAGPELLRTQARTGATSQQRDVALYLLLANELHHGWYREFLADQPMVGPRQQPKPDECLGCSWSVGDYEPTYREDLSAPPLYVFAGGGSGDLRACPDVVSTATSLAADPGAIRPRLCLAEFIRRKGFDGWSDQYDAKLDRNVARSRNGFPGKPIERMGIYQAVIASPLASADDKAFALNRAIRCYQPAGYNSCGGQPVEKPVRKAWYDRLRSQYATTVWARELKYYW